MRRDVTTELKELRLHGMVGALLFHLLSKQYH